MAKVVRRPVTRRRPAAAIGAPIVREIARLIRGTFDRYTADFANITHHARRRFAMRNWNAWQRDAARRFQLYEQFLTQIKIELRAAHGDYVNDRRTWAAVRREYARLIRGRHDIELAETFFNSVTRKMLATVGIDREVEFFRRDIDRRPRRPDIAPLFHRYEAIGDLPSLLGRILNDLNLDAPFEDIRRDSIRIASEINLYLWPIVGRHPGYHIELIPAPFYRNKCAYVVGRIRTDHQVIPMILPMYHGPSGVYVDTVLLEEADASKVLGFAFSSFHVEVSRHDALIDFLQSMLPEKPVAELYSSIGYHKHGKTEFYRALHAFVHEAREKFVDAPGKEGAVMLVFTLPDFGFVFKVIKDRPCFLRSSESTPKRISRAEVQAQYRMVCLRDRVGRMVDTQEFENLRFKTRRFSRQLLREFAQAATDTITIDKDHVVIRHLYVQRRVTPLPLFLEQEKDPETIRKIVIDFGYFLKDLAAAGIFPCDLFNTWNYGVTRRERIVLYDYDDVGPLEEQNFRVKPEPHDELDELTAEEDWIAAGPSDFFMDETERFSGIPRPLMGVLRSVHSDLFSSEFWRDMQRRVKRGEVFDITPYERSRRFPRLVENH